MKEYSERRQSYEAHLGNAIFNLRERSYDVPLARLQGTLSRLPGEDSPIWPVDYVGPMMLDGPLRVGASGGHGHGKVRYTVVEYLADVRVMFRFDPGPDQHNAMIGVHYLEYLPCDDGVTVRHVVNAEMRGRARVTWVDEKLGARHDRAVDLLFDRLQRYVGRDGGDDGR